MAVDSATLEGETRRYYGLSTDTKPTQNVIAYTKFIETDTGTEFEYTGSIWQQTKINGKVHVADGAFATEIQTDATYTYIGEAKPGTALATAAWRAQRIETATGSTKWADGDGDFDNVATDLTALSYS